MPDPAGVLTGFHGKLPASGDFVTRGLPTGLAAFWDVWAARHLARRTGWPEGGLRLRLVSGGRVAAGVVVPGADRVGRRFPLAGFVIAAVLPAPEGLNDWADAAAALLVMAGQGGMGPDALLDQLEALSPPTGGGLGTPMQLWRDGRAPQPCDPVDPGDVLTALFSCSGSLSP
ncbi:MAG: TagF domain-containing protein [Paracoccaceae bacterium]